MCPAGQFRVNFGNYKLNVLDYDYYYLWFFTCPHIQIFFYHFIGMDDMNAFTKNKKKNWRLIRTIRIYSQDKGMELDMEKCAILIVKDGKRESAEGIILPNQESIRMREEKESYKYLGILEADTIKQAEMKEKIWKEDLRQTGRLFKNKLCCRNLMKRDKHLGSLRCKILGTILIKLSWILGYKWIT